MTRLHPTTTIRNRAGKILLLFLLAVCARAQNNEPAAKKEDGKLIFVTTAARVISNLQHQTLAGYTAAAIDQKIWTPLLKDGDLGPFLKLKEPKPELRAVILILNAKTSMTFCVYFNAFTPIGIAIVQPNPAGKIDPSEVASSYKSVPKEAVREGEEELYFISGEIRSDDDQPISAYKIASAGKKTKN